MSLSNVPIEYWKWLCNFLLLVVTFVVALGAYFDREGNPEDVKRYGWKLVATGAAFQFLFAVAIWQIDSVIGRRHAKALSDANKKIAELGADNLALQEALQPRRLSFVGYTLYPISVRNVYEQLRQSPKTTALIQSVDNFEARYFAKDIEETLNLLGWEAKQVDSATTHLPDLAFAEGLTIFVFPSTGTNKLNAGAELQFAFNRLSQVKGSKQFDNDPIVFTTEGQKGFPYLDSPMPGAIIIRVGLRRFSKAFFDIQRRSLEKDWADVEEKRRYVLDHGGKEVGQFSSRTPVFINGVSDALMQRPENLSK